MNWIRVTRAAPCRICEHPDWCTTSEIGSCCMRVPSPHPLKNGGYLHKFGAVAVPVQRPEPPPRPTIDASGLMKRWYSQTASAQYDSLAEALGVAATALRDLKAAWATEYNAWAFAMRDGAGRAVGIRLRAMSGQKWSVRGGREGIFLPQTEPQKRTWIVEGPTDLCAMLTLGKFAIGRPSCCGGIAPLAATLARLRIREAVIIADNDEDKTRPNGEFWNPGLDGAKRLADEIGVMCCMVVLPCKDSREFLNSGGTSAILDSLVQSQMWIQPIQIQQKRLTSPTQFVVRT